MATVKKTTKTAPKKKIVAKKSSLQVKKVLPVKNGNQLDSFKKPTLAPTVVKKKPIVGSKKGPSSSLTEDKINKLEINVLNLQSANISLKEQIRLLKIEKQTLTKKVNTFNKIRSLILSN